MVAAPIPRRTRLAAALVGAGLAAPSALTVNPFGIYLWEQHLVLLLAAALLGAGLAQLGLWALRREGRAGAVLGGIVVLLVLAAVHSSLIAVMFSLAVHRGVVAAGAVLGAAAFGGSLRAGARVAEALLIGLLPLLLVCNVHHARFLRSPGVDCAALAASPGVTALSTWPGHGHPDLADSVVYDVIGDEEAGLVFGAFVRQRERAGCGAVAMWSLGGGEPTVLAEPFLQSEALPCWMTARLVLDRERRVLWVGMASYDPELPPRLASWSYDGGVLTPLFEGPSALDPSDLALVGDDLVVLAYPRRFGSEGSSQVEVLSAEDPSAPTSRRRSRFEPNGWMTEYVAYDDDRLYISDVFGHFYALDRETLAVQRKVRPGASTLGIAVGDRLHVAAPYRRELLELDPVTLEVTGSRPAGASVREPVLDAARGRVYSTGYGDGTVWRHDLDGASRPLPLRFGTPLRGIDLLPKSGALLVGGACGVVHLAPDALSPS